MNDKNPIVVWLNTPKLQRTAGQDWLCFLQICLYLIPVILLLATWWSFYNMPTTRIITKKNLLSKEFWIGILFAGAAGISGYYIYF